MRVPVLLAVLLMAAPAAAAQHEAHASVTRVSDGHASTTPASTHRTPADKARVEKESVGSTAETHAQATRATGTTVKVVPVPRPPRPTGNSRELAAALARISQRLSAMPAGKASAARGKSDTAVADRRIALTWRMAVDWPVELTGVEVELDPLERAVCAEPSFEQ